MSEANPTCLARGCETEGRGEYYVCPAHEAQLPEDAKAFFYLTRSKPIPHAHQIAVRFVIEWFWKRKGGTQ